MVTFKAGRVKVHNLFGEGDVSLEVLFFQVAQFRGVKQEGDIRRNHTPSTTNSTADAPGTTRCRPTASTTGRPTGAAAGTVGTTGCTTATFKERKTRKNDNTMQVPPKKTIAVQPGSHCTSLFTSARKLINL